jgi:hypothetical protein
MHALPDYIRCIWISMSFQRLLENVDRPAHILELLKEMLLLGDWASANRERMIESGCSAIDECE